MSGTSLDGVDVVVVELRGSEPAALDWRVLGFDSVPYSAGRREVLRDVIASGGPRELTRLDVEVALAGSDALRSLLDRLDLEGSDLAAIGWHGQTVWHEPPTNDERGTTLQLGDAATLAETIGCPVVSDLRSRDVAAGGHGAPLVPWSDWVLLRRPGTGRALQNLGGMGNVTFLPRHGGVEGVLGFDTGPGVALLDRAAWEASGGAEPWDRDGARAARGTVRAELLDDWMRDPFFRAPPPRSTGRERFGDERLAEIVSTAGPRSQPDWDDLLATLTEWTARSIAEAFERFLPSDAIDEVVLTGGGARNPTLVRSITRRLSSLPVATGAAALGIDPDAREAAAFALLAWAHLNRVPGNVPAVTGARGLRVLGSLTPGPRSRVGIAAYGAGADR